MLFALLLACTDPELWDELEALSDEVDDLEADVEEIESIPPPSDEVVIGDQVLLEHACVGEETYAFTWDVLLEPSSAAQLWIRYSDDFIEWNDNTQTDWALKTSIPIQADGTVSSTCFWYDLDEITGWYVEEYILVVL